MIYKLYNADSKDILAKLDENSIDSLITDPPAGISFMGKDWDDYGSLDNFQLEMREIFKEVYRVLKPGAHGLVWAIPRTSHHTTMALEKVGFEIRDVITHLFGSGFPKSLNIEKSLQKQNNISEAEQWEGWGTALKPAAEFWVLIRKPLAEKTVVDNVLKYGTGGINIDSSRIQADKKLIDHAEKYAEYGVSKGEKSFHGGIGGQFPNYENNGRFPSNLLLSHSENCTEEKCGEGCSVKLLNEQSGVSKSSDKLRFNNASKNLAMSGDNLGHISKGHSDSGGASRFFKTFYPEVDESHTSFIYCAKASTRERNEGLDGMPVKEAYYMQTSSGKPSMKDGHTGNGGLKQNHHPTVKSIKLMAYLINLITPPNGKVLDCFMGSGSTGCACAQLGFDFIGIEKEKEYFDIAEKRIEYWKNKGNK